MENKVPTKKLFPDNKRKVLTRALLKISMANLTNNYGNYNTTCHSWQKRNQAKSSVAPSHRWAQQLPLVPPTASRGRPGSPSVVKFADEETRMRDTAPGNFQTGTETTGKEHFAPEPLS